MVRAARFNHTIKSKGGREIPGIDNDIGFLRGGISMGDFTIKQTALEWLSWPWSGGLMSYCYGYFLLPHYEITLTAFSTRHGTMADARGFNSHPSIFSDTYYRHDAFSTCHSPLADALGSFYATRIASSIHRGSMYDFFVVFFLNIATHLAIYFTVAVSFPIV